MFIGVLYRKSARKYTLISISSRWALVAQQNSVGASLS
jgi:hypothetical protein